MSDVAIVGAGILGLAHAYVYASRGHRVRVYERQMQASGASVRNFGMIWPIGQPAGRMTEIAMLSRVRWLEVIRAAGLFHLPHGSLHLAYHADEEALCREFAEREPKRGTWIGRDGVLARSAAVNPDQLRGALYSDHEIVVDPRLTLAVLPAFLEQRYGVVFHWRSAVHDVSRLAADQVIVCGGDDFETLYPEIFAGSGITRIKLQMMRTVAQPEPFQLGPALAAGLTMRFYKSFHQCESLRALHERFDATMPEYGRWGIHVMASQTADRCLTLGDSHESGWAVDIFNKEEIDTLILRYLATFARFPDLRIAERWYGVYAKHPDQPYCVFQPEPGVRVVTAPGGAGMTLSFGLAETLYEA